VSLRGAFHCARAALPELHAHRGRLIVMTSPAGMEGSRMLPAYGIVKAGLRGFVKSVAREWAPLGVTVAAVSPLAETPALTAAYEQDPELAHASPDASPSAGSATPSTTSARPWCSSPATPPGT